jgi:hypothetical protein
MMGLDGSTHEIILSRYRILPKQKKLPSRKGSFHCPDG